MKITSLEIKQHEFEKSFRGYDIEEVNHFLSNIAQEWERMLNESKMLKMQLDISEKEASKLREVEMTLIKTLRTAEDTSTRLTENAATEANLKIENAEQKAAQIIAEAENTAKQLVDDAEQKVNNINTTAKAEFAELETNFAALEAKKAQFLTELKGISGEINQIVGGHSSEIVYNAPQIVQEKTVKFVSNSIEMEVEEIEIEIESEEEIAAIVEEQLESHSTQEIEILEEEEEESHGISFSSAVNEITSESEEKDNTNLELIEGIGPKIKEVLNNARIVTFRDLATTPLYRIKDILDNAGSQFASHDPSTWIEQALLAEHGQFEQLEELKKYLIAGRVPKEDFKPEKSKSEISESGNTEEMLDKVNKVKAAIRKAMVEKSEPKEPKSVNDYIAEKKQSGSFFDNLN
ncbi:DivIVA domain-containing protein [Lacihabitans sp. LS3-19]|uniref:DivIVA domain-containing protein n=1 Tax=Lacihabitans sp. LS3-19 TaxID=2487335 RepID=UPI0020CC6DA1|nr:DivIVA domain-containing protein [Lacihabitans sp. LS3-19]MCP9770328.1 DivIVA domain-containing protein [Lacihabitans sp. LS3-19]